MLRRKMFALSSGLALLCAMAVTHRAHAVIQTAGTLFVDLDARDASAGTASWTNSGTLANFTEFGNPMVTIVGPNANPAVTFDGTSDYYRGPASPIGLTGAGAAGDRSIEVWVFNPAFPGEETMVSLAKRGGPAGSNVAFNYGSDGSFGAVGHWAGADIGWNGAPAAGQWHHLVYTFDGTTTRVYADNVLKNSEDSTTANGGVPLDAHDGVDMLIAAQMEGDGTTVTAGVRGSLSIANVRVHDGVLSAAQIQNNFAEDAHRFGLADYSPSPIHRYTFDGTGGNGALVPDVIGSADGVLREADGSSLNGLGQANLGGGNSATAGYIDLPNGIVSSLTNATFEAWVTWDNSGQVWSRIFDFGDNTSGEIGGPGGSFTGNGGGGDGYIFLTPGTGTAGNMRFGDYEPGPGEQSVDGPSRLATGSEQQLVVVFDGDNDMVKLYLNGALVGQNTVTNNLSDVLDINNWLGRSNFSGDANFDGLFDEFRIYNSALTGQQVLANFLAGPNDLNLLPTVPEPTTAGLALMALAGLGLRRRERA